MCSALPGAESGTQLLVRLEGRSSLKEIEPCLFADEDSPVHGEILEFHGPEGTGKTEMLYHLTARCILPKSEGGLEVEVVFIDTDYHFDMLRLVTILEHRLSQSSEEAIKGCLGRLFLVYCSSSTQLLLTLYSLETVLCGHPSLCLLILDSLSAFYWIDRANGGESVSAQEATLKKCSHFLEKVVRGEVHLPEVSMGILLPRSRVTRNTPPRLHDGAELPHDIVPVQQQHQIIARVRSDPTAF